MPLPECASQCPRSTLRRPDLLRRRKAAPLLSPVRCLTKLDRASARRGIALAMPSPLCALSARSTTYANAVISASARPQLADLH